MDPRRGVEVKNEHPIVAFYRGHRPDARGRHLPTILAWPPRELENVHDYIQWLFPTVEPSAVNPGAPLLTDEVIAAFRSDEHLRHALVHALDVMLSFLGLHRGHVNGMTRIIRAPNWEERRIVWLRPGNHNHLRITRMLTSLRALGCEAEAQAFMDCLSDIHANEGPNRIDWETWGYWLAAAGR
jgi:opioid growth factor receptor-like protein